MRNKKGKDRNFISALAHGFAVLEVFQPERSSLSLGEIAAKVPISKTSVFRVTHTLNELGYLKFDSGSKKYYPGAKVLEMGFAALMGMKIREVARPYLEELSKTSGENVNLGILDGHEVVYIEQIKGQGILDLKLYVGSRLSAYNTAIGRAILAYLPSADLDQILERLRQIPEAQPFLGVNHKKILAVLEKVQQKGYAVDNEEWELGFRAIGAPILNRQGLPKAGVNLLFLSRKVSLNELESRYAPILIETAGIISSSLG